MKYIDADKFNEVLLDLEKNMKPSDNALTENCFTSVFWNSVSITLQAVRKAVEQSSVDVSNL